MAFAELAYANALPLVVDIEDERYVESRSRELHDRLLAVDASARVVELPEATLDASSLSLAALESGSPGDVKRLNEGISRSMSRIRSPRC